VETAFNELSAEATIPYHLPALTQHHAQQQLAAEAAAGITPSADVQGDSPLQPCRLLPRTSRRTGRRRNPSPSGGKATRHTRSRSASLCASRRWWWSGRSWWVGDVLHPASRSTDPLPAAPTRRWRSHQWSAISLVRAKLDLAKTARTEPQPHRGADDHGSHAPLTHRRAPQEKLRKPSRTFWADALVTAYC
jgi:hypothetical protein